MFKNAGQRSDTAQLNAYKQKWFTLTLMVFDKKILKSIRAQFPLAGRDSAGRARIFFDAGAGTQVLSSSVKALAKVSIESAANTGANYPESERSDQFVLEGRKAIADLLNTRKIQRQSFQRSPQRRCSSRLLTP